MFETVGQTISVEDVVWCYRMFLGRLPESEAVVESWRGRFDDIKAMAEEFMKSAEHKDWSRITAGYESDIVLYSKARHGFFFPIQLSSPRQVREHGLYDYEPEECDALKRLVRPGMTCIDLGAREGWMTCVMAASTGPDGHVISFEPGSSRHVLERAKETNAFTWVDIVDKAVGDRDGKVRYREEDIQITDSDGPSTIVIPMVTLDTFFDERERPIDVIKLDIEGAEHVALKGGERLLRKDKPALLIEINESQQQIVSKSSTRDLLNYLIGIGYGAFDLKIEPIESEIIVQRAMRAEIFSIIIK